MAGIKLYRSNSVEELADALASNIELPLSSPFAPEVILVQSLGMAKWLNLEMAKRVGIWANCKMMFPNTLINTLFSKVLPEIDENLFLDRDALLWMILERLTRINHSNYEGDSLVADCWNSNPDSCNEEITNLSYLSDYCKGEDRNFREFQLARQLAMTYDQYLTYRPELLESWEKRVATYKKEDWQAALWCSICKQNNGLKFTNKAALRSDFLTAIYSQKPIEQLPERIAVFGISSLPLFHLDILASIASLIDVSFYVMTPAKGYFSDLRSAKEKMKREIIGGFMGIDAEFLHIETGNPLLSSLGRAGADFMDSLLNFDNLEDIDIRFVEPKEDTILSMVQNDILLMRDRTKSTITTENKDMDRADFNEIEESKTILNVDDLRRDRSIVINSCHSPMREVEILNDYLLEIFDANPEITPADIIVMTPDIESYAPFVRAVFSSQEEERLKIPFSIADLSIKSVSRTVEVFINMLSMPESRFEVPFIMDILECEDVARSFALEPRDIDLIKEWINETAIRWGRDGTYRQEKGLPPFEENSWKAGLDRLMAGYAMTSRGEEFFKKVIDKSNLDQNTISSQLHPNDEANDSNPMVFNILPCDCVEGNSSRILGSFSRFFNLLSVTASKMASNMSLSEWSNFLMEVTDNFFLPKDENSSMVQEIRNALNQLAHLENITGFKTSVSSRIIKSWCDQTIGKEYRDSNFLNGGITFCAMLPMRSIPAKVICIIGLNDKIFPRIDSSPNFDLIKQHPRRCDRSLRNEDRYLFLETLISAKEKLYISYTGQGIEDNSIIPPSVVISELIDYLDQGFIADGKPLSSYIFTQHKLQPFSPAYFEKRDSNPDYKANRTGLFSYSKANCIAASALKNKKSQTAPFMKDLIAVSLNDELISLNNLISFFNAPQRYFLENTLGLYLKEQAEILEDCEPFNLDYLESYNLKDEMLNSIIKAQNRKLHEIIYGKANNDITHLQSTVDSVRKIDIYRAKGVLPHGTAGLTLYEDTENIVLGFYDKIKEYVEQGRAESLEVDIHGYGWRLKGIVSDIWGNKIVRFRLASVKAKDFLRAWIIHLACSCFMKDRERTKLTGSSIDVVFDFSQSLIIGTDKKYQFITPDDPLSLLDNLIKLYKNGLKIPLKFFPESSMAYANAIFESFDYEEEYFSSQEDNISHKGIKQAQYKFEGNVANNINGEGQSEDVKLCFRHLETPLDEEFCSLSTNVWLPILEHLSMLD